MPWIALVGPEVEENLSLRYLASALEEAGFRTELVPFNGPESFGAALEAILGREEPPLIAALSLAFQWRALDFLALAVALRERGFRGHVTAGGHFGTFTCRELLRDFPELDSIVRHEAEETLVELARALVDGRPLREIPALALRGEGGEVELTALRSPPDLERLAWPDRRGDPMTCLGHRIASLVGSRGCYARCAFCCIAAWHEQTLPGKRFRLRPVEDLADEMTWLNRELGTEIFIFHDDDFFLPGPRQSLERIEALADALEARGCGRIGTVVKARPTDVTREVFEAMVRRLGLTRVFLGVETDSEQGLRTLRRCVGPGRNAAAMGLLEELGVYVCFNLLVFDPDTTLETLEANLDFMERWGESPFNFGRVELYAGTPLLERMQSEGRASGDYLGWDYRLGDASIQRTFELAMRCFFPRNFAAGALANRLMGTRYDVEVCRFFHPAAFRAEWLAKSKALSKRLALDSVAALREIVAHVRAGGDGRAEAELVDRLSLRLRAAESAIRAEAEDLETAVQSAAGAPCRHYRMPLEGARALYRKPGGNHGREEKAS